MNNLEKELLDTLHSYNLKDPAVYDHLILLIQNKNDELTYGEILDFLGFDILDNGLLDLILQIRTKILSIKAPEIVETKIEPQQTYSLFQSKQKQIYKTGYYWDFVFIDAALKQNVKAPRKSTSLLPEIFRQVFDFDEFNDLQTSLFDFAYSENQNLLVSAPTSSGKTNVAVLCIMQMLKQLSIQKDIDLNKVTKEEISALLKETQTLCVYLTPLKALASEITQKFKSQLNKLGFQILECTGDENPPVELINSANILILTPEKFDVITRKQSNMTIFQRQKLLIIDEIHLLGVQGRGNVLESIVCRTKMAIEQLQSPLRFVGISATIPNYQDIAQFLECETKGTFVFDESYRPVPMTQFIFGIKEKQSENIPSDQEVKSFMTQSVHLKQVFNQQQNVENLLVDVKKLKERLEKTEHKDTKGKKKKPQQSSMKYDDILDELCVEISVSNNEDLNSTMIFVHSRRKCVELAKLIAAKMPLCEFDKSIIKKAQGCEKGDLAFCMSRGVGFHHAQIDKSYKRLVEDSYRKGELTVVVCTATLAWGVNLPAQTVVIRGTDIFSDIGQKDLDILDVKQIFGRAGRPQFTGLDGMGRGIILTKYEKVSQYLRWLSNDTPITSCVGSKLPDILNAEIVLGNISTVGSAIQFIRKSFYAIKQVNFQDMIIYSLQQLYANKLIFSSQKIVNDLNQVIVPTQLGKICSQFYVSFDTLTNFLKQISQLPIGQLVQHDEILHLLSLIPEFQSLKPRADENEELTEISGQFLEQATEEINKLQNKGAKNKKINSYLNKGLEKKQISRLKILSQDDEPAYKVNCLIQAFISQYIPKNQSLISDQRLIIQSLPRVAQAFLEALLTMNRLNESLRMNDIVNSILYQTWYYQASPFLPIVISTVGTVNTGQKGFQSSMTIQQKRGVQDFIQMSTIASFHKYFPISHFCDYSMLEDLTYDDLNDKIGDYQTKSVLKAIKMIPQVQVDAVAVPISSKLLRVQVFATPKIIWHKSIHGYHQTIVILIARADNGLILHRHEANITQYTINSPINLVTLLKINQWNKVNISGSQVKNTLNLGNISTDCDQNEFPILKVISFPKNWTGSYSVISEQIIPTEKIYIQEHQNIEYQALNNKEAVFQSKQTYFTPLPRLPPLSTKLLHWPEAENMFSFQFFNPIQTTMFHNIYYGRDNVFVGAPTSSGKTVAAELAILQVLKNNASLKCIYIAPIKALVRERYLDWRKRFAAIGATVVEITGDYVPQAIQLMKANIIVTTPEKWDAMSRQWHDKNFLQLVGLIILDEVHLVGTSRGYVMESIVARYQIICKELEQKIRLIGLSTPSQNVKDIAQWLKVPYQNIFNFDNAARPVKLDIHIQSFIGDKYSERMELMNRPVYSAIKKYSPTLPVLVFVQSRKQTRKTAYSLLNQSFSDQQAPECFFKVPNDDIAKNIIDPDAAHCIKFGVGIHHSGMAASDRDIIESLYLSQTITILVCTATLAAGVNMPAYMTILKGCEYFDGNMKGYVDFDIVDVQQMCGRAGRPQFIQYRIKQQMKQLLGEQVVNQLDQKKVFNLMYKFDKQFIKQFLDQNIPGLDDILNYLEQENLQQPQSISIIMCRESAKETYKQFFNEPFPFESSLLNQTLGNPLASALLQVSDVKISHFPDCVNAEITNSGTSRLELRKWLQNTFFFIRARRNPLLYGIDLKDILDDIDTLDLSLFRVEFQLYSNGKEILEQEKSKLVDFFTVLRIYAKLDAALDLLLQIKAIEQKNDYFEAIFYSTDIGKVGKNYYISYYTLNKYICSTQVTDINEAIILISEAHEFDQIPVRCDEENQMSDLAVPDCITTGSGCQKAFYVLTKKSINQLLFATPDFNLDLRTVQASVPRLCAALIEIKCIQNDFISASTLCQASRQLRDISVKCQYSIFGRILERNKQIFAEVKLSINKIQGKCDIFSCYLGCEGKFNRGKKEATLQVCIMGGEVLSVFAGSDVLDIDQIVQIKQGFLNRDWQQIK